MDQPHRAFIALGANLGDRADTLRRALDALRTHCIRVIKVSSFCDTAPVGGPADQPRYLNGAAELETELSPRALLDTLLSVEKELGRDRSDPARNQPRTIDLDLLLYDDLILNEPGLEVPHPRMHERRFVLEPLREIAPDVRHPALKRTIAELAAT